MHRHLVVAIEAEIGNWDLLSLHQLFGDGEPDKIVAVRTVTRAVLRHGGMNRVGDGFYALQLRKSSPKNSRLL